MALDNFHYVFYAALVLIFGFAMFACYAVWIYQSCTPFMPFVSDFGLWHGGPHQGGRTAIFFAFGLTGGGVLLATAVAMQYRALKEKAKPCDRLYAARLVGGIWLALSVCGVGLNPFDVRPFWHGASANNCFVMGWVYSILTCVIYRKEGKDWWWIAGCVCLSITLMITMMRTQNGMLQSTLAHYYPNIDNFASFDKFNMMASHHFSHWCKGSTSNNSVAFVTATGVEHLYFMNCSTAAVDPNWVDFQCPLSGPGPHSYFWGNFAALVEWALLIVNALPAVYTLIKEYDEKKGSLTTPFLGTN